MGNVTLILKKIIKGDRSTSRNYRPNLTSVVSKIFERIIRDKIVIYNERHSLIRESQHDFRNKRSWLPILLTFHNDFFAQVISRSLDIVFFDFQRAFDKFRIIVDVQGQTARD